MTRRWLIASAMLVVFMGGALALGANIKGASQMQLRRSPHETIKAWCGKEEAWTDPACDDDGDRPPCKEMDHIVPGEPQCRRPELHELREDFRTFVEQNRGGGVVVPTPGDTDQRGARFPGEEAVGFRRRSAEIHSLGQRSTRKRIGPQFLPDAR